MSSDSASQTAWHSLPAWFRTLAAERPGAVLLETAKWNDENCRSLLFLHPHCELIAYSPEQVQGIFEKIDEYITRGYYVAGFVSYECGYLLQGLSFSGDHGLPLIRMAVFQAPLAFDHRTGRVTGRKGAVLGSDTKDAGDEIADEIAIEDCALEIPEEDYTRRIGRIRQYLEDGHSYQVNFTDRVTGGFRGSPASLYRLLIERQPVSYAGYIDCGSYQILSFSPELFYRVQNGRIIVRPMKGTWPRGVHSEDDRRAADALRHDPKNRAEHVTIVDLLRNDLGKICAHGSIKVEELMQVERYRTLHQMTSTISGVAAPGKSSTQIFRALFPSGSITGAPKRRTMEIIREMERTPRGVYTGAIGWFGPAGEACFNVAIRTLVTSGNRFTLGVGGGITLDSEAVDEYKECRLKASFLTAPHAEFHLIETMRAVNGEIPLLDRHLTRLRNSADYFHIAFDEPKIREVIHQALREDGHVELRVRLTLDCDGQPAVQSALLDPVSWGGKIMLSPLPVSASDIFRYHKTSNRHGYDAALAEAQERGFDEVLFLNQSGRITEGAIDNVFLHLRGRLVTPAIGCGVLPGVQRAQILDANPKAQCASLSLTDLEAADQIWFCNAVRGLRAVETIYDSEGNLLWSRAKGGLPLEALIPPARVEKRSDP